VAARDSALSTLLESGDKQMKAFVFVRARLSSDIASRLARITEVEEVHRVAGEDCYVVRVRTASAEDLDRLVRNKIECIKAVYSTRTTLILKTIKDQLDNTARRSKAASAVRSGN